MKYYKAFNFDMTCKGFQYEVGKTYELLWGKALKICECGFHFCDILNACFQYYSEDECIVCEVEPLGRIIKHEYENKLVTDKIKIVKKLSKDEIEEQRYIVQDGVTIIGCHALNDCKLLKNITIPSSVTRIGYGAFENCTLLESIIIPDSVIQIGACAFYYCISLESITIPNSVISIGTGAFHGCTSLREITIPSNVTYIGDWAFDDCTSLKGITIPDNEE